MPVALAVRHQKDPEVRPETRRLVRQFIAVHPGHVEVGHEDVDLAVFGKDGQGFAAATRSHHNGCWRLACRA